MDGRKLPHTTGPSKVVTRKAEPSRKDTRAKSAVLYYISVTFWALVTQ